MHKRKDKPADLGYDGGGRADGAGTVKIKKKWIRPTHETMRLVEEKVNRKERIHFRGGLASLQSEVHRNVEGSKER